MPINYRHHGGLHQVSVVQCPRILGNRLAHLSQDGPGSWALRDFITDQMIRNAPPPNVASSTQTLVEIEAEVTYSEVPPFYAIENVIDWSVYLRLRTMAVMEVVLPDMETPNPHFGNWQVISPRV